VVNGYSFTEAGNRIDNTVEGKVIEDSTLAQELLPTCEGFFFGGTDYDEYYYNDLVETKEMLTKLLEEDTEGSMVDYEYWASW
jgi:cobyrinic acid a,c-diamide synthase